MLSETHRNEVANWHFSCIFRCMIAVRIPAIFIIGAICLIFASGALAKPGLVKISVAKSQPPPPAAKTAAAQSAATKSPAPSPPPKQSVEWQLIKVGARDYLSADNIAKFYGLLGNVDSTGKTVVLNNGRNQLQLTLDSREAIVNGVRNWLCFPVIAQDDKFLVSRIDLAKTIEPQLRPQMLQPRGQVKTVVLDPGHGGHDKGARSRLGNEKEFTLDVARKLRPLLQAKGFKVILTRENDAFIPLHVRAHIANQTQDSILVSIHFNGASNPDATGFEIFSLTPRGAPSTSDHALALHFVNMQAGSPVDAQSFGLSAAIYHSMLGHLAEVDRGIKRARFAVLRHTKIPAVLVEGGFLSEADNSKRVSDPAWRSKFAEALCVGIENYRNVVEKKERPMLVAEYRAKDGGEITLRDLARPPAQLEPSPAPEVVPAPSSPPGAASDQEP